VSLLLFSRKAKDVDNELLHQLHVGFNTILVAGLGVLVRAFRDYLNNLAFGPDARAANSRLSNVERDIADIRRVLRFPREWA
jgi:hypothetical protein